MQFHFKTRRRPHAADGGKGAAKQNGAVGELAATGVLADDVQMRPHRRQRAVLVGNALAVFDDMRTQHQLVPVRQHIDDAPQRTAYHLGADLLGNRDRIGFSLAVGVVGAAGDPQLAVHRHQHEFGFTRGVWSDHLHGVPLQCLVDRAHVVQRKLRRGGYADGLEFLNMVVHGGFVTRRPAAYDQAFYDKSARIGAGGGDAVKLENGGLHDFGSGMCGGWG